MPLIDNVISRVQSELNKRQWSKAELARRSGIHVTTISRILHGHLEPSVSACEAIANALGMKPEKLFQP